MFDEPIAVIASPWGSSRETNYLSVCLMTVGDSLDECCLVIGRFQPAKSMNWVIHTKSNGTTIVDFAAVI